jgi:hypothetical protein
MDYWRGLERRLAFRQSIRGEAGDRCVVVSLGPACLAWIMFNRWGFRNHPAAVASFNPFCLAGHRAGAVAGMPRDGLDAYAPLDRIKEITWRDGGIMVGRTDAAALWSHHAGAHWHAGGDRLGKRACQCDPRGVRRLGGRRRGLITAASARLPARPGSAAPDRPSACPARW